MAVGGTGGGNFGGGGGLITITNNPTPTQTQITIPLIKSFISVEDPYICGTPIKGQVNSNNLDKVFLIFESQDNSNISYTINPKVNSDGSYTFDPIGIIAGQYKVTYYGTTKDGIESHRLSYLAEIKSKENCTPTSVVQSGQQGVLDFVFSPITTTKKNIETLRKLASAPEFIKKSNETLETIRTGGQNIQSVGAIIFILIAGIWLTNSQKQE